MGTNSNDAHNDLLEVEFPVYTPVSSPDSFTDFLDKNDDKIFEDFDFNNLIKKMVLTKMKIRL